MSKTHSVLIIGNGGREHAIAWKLSSSKLVYKIYCSPGNAGTAEVGQNVSLDLTDNKNVVDFARKNKIGLVIVTPDDYLAAGMVDALLKAKIPAFGPRKKAAQIESSKSFAKKIMDRAKVPTASFKTFTDFEKARDYIASLPLPIVIKASGLALGKGVIVAQNHKEAVEALQDIMVKKVFGDAGSTVIIEEFLKGTEVSIHAFCDGKTSILFPASQDHKQIYDGDRGANTGGMGTVAPVPWVTPALLKTIQITIIEPILKELKKSGSPFTGILYPGLMITQDGPKVLEFNARFGDPETQSYMRLLDTDLFPILMACVKGTLPATEIHWKDASAVCIVIASRGYPESSEKGVQITGLDKAAKHKDVEVFQAGIKLDGKNVLTDGGRVLGVTATGNSLNDALRKAYGAVRAIRFAGMQYRSDIGRRKPFRM